MLCAFGNMVIQYSRCPEISNEEMNGLFFAAWEDHQERDFESTLDRKSQFWVCGRDEGFLVGFVKVVWDMGMHAFVLDTTTHPSYQRRGIGGNLLREAIAMAKDRSIEWLHVDFEAKYKSFYSDVGFMPTDAGLINLRGGT